MPDGFDNIATTYDDGFVNTVTGKMQRNIVWDYLVKHIVNEKSMSILELNCGTGEDAIWLASHGHKVLATDVSVKMVSVAKIKAETAIRKEKISFATLDIANPDTYPSDKKFDLIFSNFGGLNCISHLSFYKVVPEIARLLAPEGRFIAVIMSRSCLWERLYFSVKGKFSKANRRSGKQPLKVSIEGNNVDTWYYSPAQTENICNSRFKTIKKLPLGFFLPPSYMDSYFTKHPKFLKLLKHLEDRIGSISVLSPYSDHFLIDMEVRS